MIAMLVGSITVFRGAAPAEAVPSLTPSAGAAQRLAELGEAALPAVAVSGDDTFVAWQDRSVMGGPAVIAVKTSSDGGNTFGRRFVASGYVGGDATHPSIAANGDHVVVAWHETTDWWSSSHNNKAILVATSRTRGSSWSRPIRVDLDDADSRDPVVAIEGAAVQVAWSDISGNVRTAGSSDGGITWRAPLTLSAAPASVLGQVAVAVEGSRWAIAWSGGGRPVLATSLDGGVTFGPEEAVPAENDVRKVDVEIIDGTPVVAWTRGDKGVGVARRLPAGFGTPVSAAPSGRILSDLAVARDRLIIATAPARPKVGLYGGLSGAASPGPNGGVRVYASRDGGVSWSFAGEEVRSVDGVLAVPRDEDDPVSPTARMGYSVPDHFFDGDLNGAPDERQDAPEWIHRTAFPVDVDACRSAPGSGTIASYQWDFDGDDVYEETTTACAVRHVFGAEQTYRVKLKITNTNRQEATAFLDVVVKDLLVVSIGDSVGSGEGNPEVLKVGGTPAQWADRRCHRTALAGPAQAALAMEMKDPHTSVTFIHLACSGASVMGTTLANGGILTPYEGIEPASPPLPPQLDQLKALLREPAGSSSGADLGIDAMFISIGANDAEFSGTVVECLVFACNAADEPAVEAKLARLPLHYYELAKALGHNEDGTVAAGALVQPGQVFLSEYFDPTKVDSGAWDMSCALYNSGSITPTEARWADEHVLAPLNAHVKAGAARWKWNHVGGIASAFRPHGYCATDRWVVDLEQSVIEQGNEKGAFHPNNAGHRLYGDRLASTLATRWADDPSVSPIANPMEDRGGDAYLVSTDGAGLFSRPGEDRVWVSPLVVAGDVMTALPAHLITGDTGTRVLALAAAAGDRGPVSVWTGLQAPSAEGGATDGFLPFAAGPPPRPNFAVRGVEIVQAPQSAVRSVAGKSTTVRVRVANEFGTAKVVPIRLRTTTTPAAGSPLSSERTIAVRVLPGVHDVGLPPDAPLVIPPDAVAYQVKVELDPHRAYTETSVADNVATARTDVAQSRKVKVLYLPVGTAGALPGCPAVDGVSTATKPFLAAVLPVADDSLVQRTSCEAGVTAEQSLLGVTAALGDLGALARASGYDVAVGVVATGWLQGAVGAPVVGTALLGSSTPTAGALVEAGRGGDVVAHEIAHAYGLDHTDHAPAPGWWPATNAPRERSIDLLDPAVQVDPWISADTYEGLLQAFERTLPDPELIVIRGGIRANGDFVARHWERGVGILDVALDAPTGALTLEYLGGATVLATTRFDASSPADIPGVSGDQSFALRVPHVPGTTALRISRGGVILHERAVSANAPTVTVTAPVASSVSVGGTIDLAWDATDADGVTTLLARIEATNDDGASWVPIAIDVAGGARSIAATSHLIGGGVRFRVTVSDGVLTASDESATISVRPVGANGRFAIATYEDTGASYNLLLVPPEGGSPTTLYRNSFGSIDMPAWSPDGSRIVYAAQQSQSELWTIDATTGSRTIVRPRPDTADNETYSCPKYTSDGSQILVLLGAMTGAAENTKGLALVPTDGSTAPEIIVPSSVSPTTGRFNVKCGAYSPDGSKLAFLAWDDAFGGLGLYVQNRDGSGRVRIPGAHRLRGFGEPPSWSPTGSEIAVVLDGPSFDTPVFGDCRTGDLCGVAVDGSSGRRLVSNRAHNPFGHGGPINIRNGVWSGDGASVAYRSWVTDSEEDLSARVIGSATSTLMMKSTSANRVQWADWERRPVAAPPAPAGAAADAGGPYAGRAGEPVVVDASATKRRPGDQAPAFAWDLDGDGGFDDAAGIAPSVLFDAPGTHTITLAVTDVNGVRNTDTAVVQIAAVAPVVTADRATLTAAVGIPVRVEAAFAHVGTGPRTATVDWLDGPSAAAGVTEGNGGGVIGATHSYASPGTRAAVVSVCSSGVCGSATVTIEVLADPAPVLDAVTPASAPAAGGSPIVLTGRLLGTTSRVTFGGTPATSFEVLGDEAVRVVTPTRSPGGAVIAVTTTGGTDVLPFTFVNQPVPAVADVSAATYDRSPIEISLDASSPDRRPLRFEVLSGPAHGKASVDGIGVVAYTAEPTFTGTDTLTYRAIDDRGGVSSPATVRVRVGNTAPTVGEKRATTSASTPLSFAATTLLAGASDADGDPIRLVQAYGDDTSGEVGYDGTTVRYVPAPGFAGTSVVEFLVGDGVGGLSLGRLLIDVAPPTPTPTPTTVPPTAPAAPGYRVADGLGRVASFGNAGDVGSLEGVTLNAPIVAMTKTPSGNGFWMGAADGGVFAFGDAFFHGSLGNLRLNQPIVGMAATPDGGGYWLVASDGGVFTFGDAPFSGSLGSLPLNSPIVGMSPTRSGLGYWLVAADGGVFTFGDAGFFDSLGSVRLNSPIVAMAPTATGGGYWLVAADGGVFNLGEASSLGSVADLSLHAPIHGVAINAGADGLWLVGEDGGVFAIGAAPFLGRVSERAMPTVVAIA